MQPQKGRGLQKAWRVKTASTINKANLLFVDHVMIFGIEIQGYLGTVLQSNWDRNKHRQVLYSLQWAKGKKRKNRFLKLTFIL